MAVQAWDAAHGYAPSVFTENGGPAVVNARITLSDVDSATLSGATVKIAGNFASGEDVLNFTTQGGITGTYDAQTGVLTLSGTASLADYQAVLRSATYENTSESPSGLPRTIEFQVNDGAAEHAASNVVAVTVNVTPVNDAPVLDYFNLTVAEGGTTVLSTNDFHITDPDSSSFFFSFANVTGGEFQVFNGTNWISAPTGGPPISSAAIAAGHVRFCARRRRGSADLHGLGERLQRSGRGYQPDGQF